MLQKRKKGEWFKQDQDFPEIERGWDWKSQASEYSPRRISVIGDYSSIIPIENQLYKEWNNAYINIADLLLNNAVETANDAEFRQYLVKINDLLPPDVLVLLKGNDGLLPGEDRAMFIQWYQGRYLKLMSADTPLKRINDIAFRTTFGDFSREDEWMALYKSLQKRSCFLSYTRLSIGSKMYFAEFGDEEEARGYFPSLQWWPKEDRRRVLAVARKRRGESRNLISLSSSASMAFTKSLRSTHGRLELAPLTTTFQAKCRRFPTSSAKSWEARPHSEASRHGYPAGLFLTLD